MDFLKACKTAPSESLYTFIFESVKTQLPQWISKASDLNILYYLNSHQRTYIYESIKDRLPELIYSSEDFEILFRYFNSEQCESIYKQVEDRIPEWIHTPKDVKLIFSHLTAEQALKLCKKIKTKLQSFAPSMEPFLKLLEDTKHFEIIYETITGRAFPSELDLDQIRARQIAIPGSTHYFHDVLVNKTSAEKLEELAGPKMDFELALIDKDTTALKKSFDVLAKKANTHRSRFFYFGRTGSCSQLINNLANLEKLYLEQLNEALDLKLDMDNHLSEEEVKQALWGYVDGKEHNSQCKNIPN